MGENNAESFVFYESFYDSICDLENKDQLPIFKAICEYALYGETNVKLPRYANMLFKSIKPQIDANRRRRDNGGKGGRPKKETIGFENKQP